MARPRKTGVTLDKMIGVRIDRTTLAAWTALARASGLTLGEWARAMIQGNQQSLPVLRRAPPPAADPKLLAAVGRCGNNLNQLARAANRSGVRGEQLRALLACLIDIERCLDEALRNDD